MASKYPKILRLFLLLYYLSEKQNFFLFFYSDFGCLVGGSEGSIESQQKFDFFSYDGMP